jgi:Invasion associated locus B (IalB) protein
MMMLAAILLALATPAGRVTLGVYQSWAAFRDAAPARCFAIAAPVEAGAAGRVRPFASIASHFGRSNRSALFVRLSTVRNLAVPVTLSIDDRRFTLSGGDAAAWAPDAQTDRAIVAAMRGARSMSVAAVSARGQPFADTYALAGAATAIDAAALGCAR